MERDGDAATVLMLKTLMAAFAPGAPIKTIAGESGNNFAGGQTVEMGILDAHRLKRSRQRVRRKTPLLRPWTVMDGNDVLAQFVDYHY